MLDLAECLIFRSENCLELLRLCDSLITLVLVANLAGDMKLDEVSFNAFSLKWTDLYGDSIKLCC